MLTPLLNLLLVLKVSLALSLPVPVCGEWSDGFRSTKEVRDDTRQRIDTTARMRVLMEAR